MEKGLDNDFLKKIQNTIGNADWMKKLYSSEKADQQAKIKGVFTVVSDNNITNDQKKALENQAESLEEKVERLEAKMAVLEEQLAENEEIIAKHAQDITNLITQAENKSKTLENKQKDYVKDVIEDVFYAYQQGGFENGADAIVPEIRARLKDSPMAKKYGGQIEEILGRLDAKEAEVANLVASADKWISQKQLLQSQYGATKSTYDLLKTSISRIGTTESSYTNSDFNQNVPTYSPEKVGIVSKFAQDPAINTPAGLNPNYIEGSTAPNPKNITIVNEKYKDLMGTPANGADPYTYENIAVQNLGKALDMGLMDDLTSAGLSYNQVVEFLSTNFAGAKLYNSEDGFKIPYGHGTEAAKVFAKLTEGMDKYSDSTFGALNTWDKEGGNTISSNKQIASLAKNYDEILSTMGESGFTFKEAMYALFDPNNGIFKDSGIEYKLSEQGEIPNYFIDFAGDKQTSEMYKNVSDKIFEIWGVKPSRGGDVGQYDEEVDPPGPIIRTDPMWFNIGDDKNNKYSFAIDRDKDGTFSGASDFVGGTSDSSWLEDLRSLDTDKDGKLTGKELDNLKVLGTNFTDNATTVKDNNEYSPDKVTSGKEYVREETTNIEYTLNSASNMGITEIDLNNLDNQVNQSENIFDVNGSEKFSDTFIFKMNGQDVVAQRQDETVDYMNTVYSEAYGKNFSVSLDETKVQEIMDKDYGEYEDFEGKYNQITGNVNILRNAGQLAQETKAVYQDALDRIADDQNVELIKASNKAASFKNTSNWNTISSEVRTIAMQEGITIDMVQAKGIYILDSGLDAKGVVEKYKEQVAKQQDVIDGRIRQKEAWRALILTTQAGVPTTADEIRELLDSGKAKTAEDIVKILKDKVEQGVKVETIKVELGFDSEREQEIYDEFNKAFAAIGQNDKVVDALALLCKEQQNNPNYMPDKSAQQLAQEIMEKMGL